MHVLCTLKFNHRWKSILILTKLMGLTTEWQYQTRPSYDRGPLCWAPISRAPGSPGRPRWVRASSSAPCCCSLGAWRGGPGGWWAGCGAAPPPPPSCCSRTSRCRSRPSSPRPAHLNEESDSVWPMWSRINFFLSHNHSFVWRFYFTVCLSFPCHNSPTLISFFC